MNNKKNLLDMVEITDTSEIQKLLYGMLKDFHAICSENNLYYCVFGGTMLGAVREQAIIPWDDDIDVCMPRKDYEQFCRIVEEKYSDKYTVKCGLQDGYAYNFGKFCMKNTLLVEKHLIEKLSNLMLFIDVFPVDGYPPESEEKKHFDKLRFYKKARCNSVVKIAVSKIWWKKPFFLVKFLRVLPYRLIGYKYFIKKEIDESKKYPFESSEYVSMQGAGWNEKGKLKKSTFLNRRLYKFGDIEIYGISDYDELLTRFYGDYLTPPPLEKRISNHSYKLYVKNDLVQCK